MTKSNSSWAILFQKRSKSWRIHLTAQQGSERNSILWNQKRRSFHQSLSSMSITFKSGKPLQWNNTHQSPVEQKLQVTIEKARTQSLHRNSLLLCHPAKEFSLRQKAITRFLRGNQKISSAHTWGTISILMLDKPTTLLSQHHQIEIYICQRKEYKLWQMISSRLRTPNSWKCLK